MVLISGLMDVIRTHLANDDLTDIEILEIARHIVDDKEFEDTLITCIKYYRMKQKRGELENDGMGNIKRK